MKVSGKPFVTVLTPVYNTEKYLEECIRSVLAQTYNNWEYVIVDNCSTDRSANIARKYGDNDQRIRVVHNKEFLDMFKNWNHALHQIAPDSKYCKIVHADDWLFKDCLKEMVNVAESNPNVGIVGSYRLEETKVTCDGLPYPSTIISGKEICRSRLKGGPFVFGSPSTLLIRSDIIRSKKYFYNESNIHADNEICFELLQDWDFGYVHQVLTFTRRHNEANTAYTRRMNTFIAADFFILIKYGPVLLSSDEYQLALDKYLTKYYRVLADSVLHLREKEFWTYHKKELKNMGYPINYLKLFTSSLKFIYNKVLERMRLN